MSRPSLGDAAQKEDRGPSPRRNRRILVPSWIAMAGGGHLGSVRRADRLHEAAFEQAFLLRSLNVEK